MEYIIKILDTKKNKKGKTTVELDVDNTLYKQIESIAKETNSNCTDVTLSLLYMHTNL